MRNSLFGIKHPELVWAFIGLAVTIILSNAPDYFLDFLLHDDSLLYADYSKGLTRDWASYFYPLMPYVEWPLFKLMVGVSPGFARFVSVIVYLVPTSFCLYILYRNIWGLKPAASFYAAVVPFILPFQLTIPAGLNNSYPLPTALAAVLLMLTGGLFAVKSFYKAHYLVVSFLLIVFIALYSPNAPFVLAAVSSLFFCLLLSGRKRVVILLFASVVAAAWSTWHQLNTPRKTPTPFSFEDFLSRLELFFNNFVLPLPTSIQNMQVIGTSVSAILATVLILLLVLATFRPTKSVIETPSHFLNLNDFYFRILFIVFSLSWIFLTAFPYLTIVPNSHQSRYYWFSGIGVAALVPYALQAFQNYTFTKRITTNSIILIVFVTGIASANYYESRSQLVNKNKISESLRYNLSQRQSYPPASQVIYISDDRIPHRGVSEANTGFIWYLLGKNNIEFAQIYGPQDEKYWYDLFKVETQNWWQPQLNGLELTKPIFIYKDIDKELHVIPMFLSVKVDLAGQELWTLYSLDLQSGKSEVLTVGIGENTYINYLVNRYGRLDIKAIQRDIAFGLPSETQRYLTR